MAKSTATLSGGSWSRADERVTAADPVRSFLVRHLADRLSAVGVDPASVPDDMDLVAEGVLDSLGLIELLGALEGRFGVELDLEGLDSDSLGVVGPFSHYIAEQVAAHNTGP